MQSVCVCAFCESACIYLGVFVVFFPRTSKSEHLFVCRFVCAPVGCMWLMKRNLLMCLHIDISQDLSCSSEKLKPLTFFRLTFPWAAGSVGSHTRLQHHNYISFTPSSAPCQIQMNVFALKTCSTHDLSAVQDCIMDIYTRDQIFKRSLLNIYIKVYFYFVLNSVTLRFIYSLFNYFIWI